MFDIIVQDPLDVGGQLVDHGEVAEDRGAVRDDDGPHRRRQQHGFPGHRGVLE